jgi:ligand-binding sensor domain-containing protein/signal transduction histidine kinase
MRRGHLLRHGPAAPRAALIICLAAVLAASSGSGVEESLVDKLVVGRNADGELEVFKVDREGRVLHRWQKQATGDWTSWCSLGGSFCGGISVANGKDGRMAIFGVDRASGAVEYAWQQATNSPDWTAWTSLGGKVRSPVAVGQAEDGRLEVFAVAGSGALKHIWQTEAGGGWSPWADLGGALEPKLAVARNRDGRLELFGLGAISKDLVHCWQRRANEAGDWTPWSNLGGPMLADFVLGQNTAGILEVFAVALTNHAAIRICQSAPTASADWTSWRDFGGQLKPGIAVEHTGDGRLELFAADDKDSTLLHRWENLTNSSDIWSAWTPTGQSAAPCPALGENEDGNLEVFALDLTNAATIHHRRQICGGSDWLDWSSLDHGTYPYNSRTWQVDEGLPDNVVQALAQTADGYLWVGTREGLARFDGLQFATFNARNTPELRSSAITSLCADRAGALWIGTDGGGLTCVRGRSLSHYGKAEGLAGENLRVIYQRKDGSLWIGTTTGMSCLQEGKFRNYTKAQGLSSEVVTSLYEDRDTNLWIATGEGLERLNGTNMESFIMPNGLPGDSVRGICQDKGGRVWIGSNNGMLWYDWYWQKHFYAYNSRYGLSDTFVSAICEDGEGNLWVGTYSGLNRFHEGRFLNQLNQEGFPFGKVNALCEDREGNLWVGSNEGLARLTPERFQTYTRRQGLTHNNVTTVMQDRDGSLWVGTWGGGLNRLKDEKVTAYVWTNGFSESLILSTCQGRDGSLWIGADFDGGLTRLKDGQLTHYTWKDGLPKAGLRVLHEDGQGDLWIGTSGGLSCFRSGRFTNYTVKDGLCGDSVRAICEDDQGRVWFGTDGGLNCWQGGHFSGYTSRQGLKDNAILALHEDKEHNLWIGTAAGGLNRFRDNRLSAYTSREGLFSDEIFEILEDDEGWFWMSCSQGVFRVRKKDLDALDHDPGEHVASLAYGKSDGMESAQCSGAAKPGGWKTSDGRLWFATSKGLVTVDPKTTRVDLAPPPIYVEQLVADRRVVTNLGCQVMEPEDPPGSVRVRPGRGELEFHFTALSLQAPENSRFKYKLEGLDADWVDSGTRRVAHYNNVYPSRYTFRVIGCNKDGVWNERGAVLAVELLPHFWQMWWLRVLAGLLVVGAASGTARYVTARRLQRQLELLEQRHAIDKERRRIAKDMHDQLGAGLTQVGLLGELTRRDAEDISTTRKHAGNLCTVVRELAQTLDEIVWTVNPKNDSLNRLAAYMAVYAEDFFRTASIRCRLDIPPGLPPYPLSAELRHNLFLSVKEALNNIVKHASASEARLQFTLNQQRLEIVVQDNGNGFVFDSARALGNGLSNMKERIEGLGGNFELSSRPNEGTCVRFEIPLKGLPVADGE